MPKNRFSLAFAVAVFALAAPAFAAESLSDVAARGVVAEVKSLLDAGVPVDTKQTGTGWTPLIAAVQAGKRDVAKLLLERGAKPDLAGATGYTALMAATQKRDVSLIRLLLLRGANPNKATPKGLTPLMIAAGNASGGDAQAGAADLACVKLLLRGGADPERVHTSGATALSVADERKNVAVASYLRRVGGGSGGGFAITGDGAITGTLSYRERIAANPGTFGVVRLLDTAPKTPIVLAQTVTKPLSGKQVPLRFSLPYKAAVLQARIAPRFAVDARFVSGSATAFETTKPVPVLTPASPGKNIALLLTRSTTDTAKRATDALSATDRAIAAGYSATRTGSVAVGELQTSYTASFLGGQLVRVVATSTQGDYGNRTDRFYFGDGADASGNLRLRAAFLTARRQARTLPSVNTGESRVITGTFENVSQKIVWSVDDAPLLTGKTVDKQQQTVSAPDMTAARNFARIITTNIAQSLSQR